MEDSLSKITVFANYYEHLVVPKSGSLSHTGTSMMFLSVNNQELENYLG